MKKIISGALQFLIASHAAPEDASALILPVPFERTVSYGTGTAGGPAAILAASHQLELFDEETHVDFSRHLHCTLDPFDIKIEESISSFLGRLQDELAEMRGRFTIVLGGEHLLTYGAVMGLAPAPENLTIVHVDAHADMADKLGGLHWSHGTVMRRLWEKGCSFLQIGVRSASREEYEFLSHGERVKTWYAHELEDRWEDAMGTIAAVEGDLYLSFDYDGLDPSIIPSTGTPQPDGMNWRQAMQLLKAVSAKRLIGADFVEFVPSPVAPGCDLSAAKLVFKLLAFRVVQSGMR